MLKNKNDIFVVLWRSKYKLIIKLPRHLLKSIFEKNHLICYLSCKVRKKYDFAFLCYVLYFFDVSNFLSLTSFWNLIPNFITYSRIEYTKLWLLRFFEIPNFNSYFLLKYQTSVYTFFWNTKICYIRLFEISNFDAYTLLKY